MSAFGTRIAEWSFARRARFNDLSLDRLRWALLMTFGNSEGHVCRCLMSDREATRVRSPFARVVWEGDRLRVGNVHFLTQAVGAPDLEPVAGGEPCFVLYKPKQILDVYEAFLRTLPEYRPSRIFEIGIWKAGSVVFFTELFDVEKLVAIDLVQRSQLAPTTLAHLDTWLDRDDHRRRTKLYFEVDQGDGLRLREIVRTEFSEALDLVIDDGSHLYGATKRSFESLFPHVKPGGWYVIEDWSWSFASMFQQAGHPWALEVPLAHLIGKILTLAGARPDIIPEMRVVAQIVFIQRGPGPLHAPFSIERSVGRPPHGPLAIRLRRAWWSMIKFSSRLMGRLRTP